MANNVKYLSYEGLSHFKNKLDNTYAPKSHTHSYLPLTGGTMTGIINSQSIIPTATNTYDLGSSSLKWSNVYATTFTGNLKGAMLGIVPNSSAGSAITEIPNAIRFDSVLVSNTTSGFGDGHNNAILTIGRYRTTKYASQLGFSGNGKLYYRSFNNAALDDSKTWNQIVFTSDIPTSLKNPYSLTIVGNNTQIASYDGSSTVTATITAASIGAATASHAHSANNITSGTLSVSRGGTGLSTITTGHVIIGNGTGTPTTSKIVSITNAEIDTIFTK